MLRASWGDQPFSKLVKESLELLQLGVALFILLLEFLLVVHFV